MKLHQLVLEERKAPQLPNRPGLEDEIQSKGDIGRAMADFILKRQDEIQQQIDDGNDLSVSARKITQKSVSEHVKQNLAYLNGRDFPAIFSWLESVNKNLKARVAPGSKPRKVKGNKVELHKQVADLKQKLRTVVVAEILKDSAPKAMWQGADKLRRLEEKVAQLTEQREQAEHKAKEMENAFNESQTKLASQTQELALAQAQLKELRKFQMKAFTLLAKHDLADEAEQLM